MITLYTHSNKFFGKLNRLPEGRVVSITKNLYGSTVHFLEFKHDEEVLVFVLTSFGTRKNDCVPWVLFTKETFICEPQRNKSLTIECC